MKGSVLATIFSLANRNKWFSSISLLLLLVTQLDAKATTQPNILFIVVDNQPASILATYGNPDVSTPNIDQLASEGVRFTNAFAVHGMCHRLRPHC